MEASAFGELLLPIRRVRPAHRRQAQGQLLGEVLRFAAGTDVVSEFLEGGFDGRHPQALAEWGLSDHGL